MEDELTLLKKSLKQWEYDFNSKTGRKPSEPDITSNPDIYAMYRRYKLLKKFQPSPPENKKGKEKPNQKSQSISKPASSSSFSASSSYPLQNLDHFQIVEKKSVSEAPRYEAQDEEIVCGDHSYEAASDLQILPQQPQDPPSYAARHSISEHEFDSLSEHEFVPPASKQPILPLNYIIQQNRQLRPRVASASASSVPLPVVSYHDDNDDDDEMEMTACEKEKQRRKIVKPSASSPSKRKQEKNSSSSSASEKEQPAATQDSSPKKRAKKTSVEKTGIKAGMLSTNYKRMDLKHGYKQRPTLARQAARAEKRNRRKRRNIVIEDENDQETQKSEAAEASGDKEEGDERGENNSHDEDEDADADADADAEIDMDDGAPASSSSSAKKKTSRSAAASSSSSSAQKEKSIAVSSSSSSPLSCFKERLHTKFTATISSALERIRSAADESNVASSDLLLILRSCFGHNSFQQGQETAIRRLLFHKSTLAVFPTGHGKSLCYQFAAFVLNKPCLVISPLIALMADQMERLPPCLSGAYLTTNTTQQKSPKGSQQMDEIDQVMHRLFDGQVDILFVSPERLSNEGFLSSIMAQHESFSSFSFVVVDEAHCLLEWSHNFRVSYLRLGNVIKERLCIDCVLALTATATRGAEISICNELNIPMDAEEDDGIIRLPSARPNLLLTASMLLSSPADKEEMDRNEALLTLLRTNPFWAILSDLDKKNKGAILVYTNTQRDADTVASFLEQKLTSTSVSVAAYHAGLTPKQRQRIQTQFMANKINIIVATVAFGMGLDKRNIRAVLHHAMPSSVETYVQEVGRAGRDGLVDAYGHCLLSYSEYFRQHCLLHGDLPSEDSILDLIKCIFAQRPQDRDGDAEEQDEDEEDDDEVRWKKLPVPFEAVLSMDACEYAFDCKVETIQTVLSLMELDYPHVLSIHSTSSSLCANITFYKGDPKEKNAGGRIENPIIAAIVESGVINARNAGYAFDFLQVSRRVQMPIHMVQKQLMSHAVASQYGCKVDMSQYSYKKGSSNTARGMVLRVSSVPAAEAQLVAVAKGLHQKLKKIEESRLSKLNSLYSGLCSFAFPTFKDAISSFQSLPLPSISGEQEEDKEMADCVTTSKSTETRAWLQSYFGSDEHEPSASLLTPVASAVKVALFDDLRHFLDMNMDRLRTPAERMLNVRKVLSSALTDKANVPASMPAVTANAKIQAWIPAAWVARSLTRMMYGMSSPLFPSADWYRCSLWRRGFDKRIPFLDTYALALQATEWVYKKAGYPIH